MSAIGGPKSAQTILAVSLTRQRTPRNREAARAGDGCRPKESRTRIRTEGRKAGGTINEYGRGAAGEASTGSGGYAGGYARATPPMTTRGMGGGIAVVALPGQDDALGGGRPRLRTRSPRAAAAGGGRAPLAGEAAMAELEAAHAGRAAAKATRRLTSTTWTVEGRAPRSNRRPARLPPAARPGVRHEHSRPLGAGDRLQARGPRERLIRTPSPYRTQGEPPSPPATDGCDEVHSGEARAFVRRRP